MSEVLRSKPKLELPIVASEPFRRFCMAEFASMFCAAVHTVAISWMAYRMAGSTWFLGVLMLLQSVPYLVFSSFTGVIADMFPRKKILIATRLFAIILISAFLVMITFNVLTYWSLSVLTFLIGVINAVEIPTSKSAIPFLVKKESIASAVSTVSLMYYCTKTMGSIVAGIVMHNVGIIYCPIICIVSLVLSILLLTTLRSDSMGSGRREVAAVSAIKEGFTYAKKNKTILEILIMIAIMGMLANNYGVIAPDITRNVLDKGGKTFAFLLSALSLGSTMGSLLLTLTKSTPKMYKTIMLISSTACSVFIFTTAFVNNYNGMRMLFFLIGFCNVIFFNLAGSLLQINASDDYRGRVSGLHVLAHLGSKTMGGFLAGEVVPLIGMVVTLEISASIILLWNLFLLSREYLNNRLRRGL